MNFTRATKAGLLNWALIFTAFALSASVQILDDTQAQQWWFIGLALVPATWLSAKYYYQKSPATHGLALGLFMAGVAIVMEVVITVPFFIIPEGGSYTSFFSDWFFWLAMGVNTATVWVYSTIRFNTTKQQYACVH